MFQLSLVILILFHAGAGQAGTTVSMGYENIYNQQPTCVQNCIWYPVIDETADVAAALQCDYPVLNACYCASAAAPAASGYLTSCVSAHCEAGDAGILVTSAVSIYDNYCVTAGYAVPGFTTAVPTPTTMVTAPSASPGRGAPTNGVTQTGSTGPTSSASSVISSSSGGNSDGLSRPAELATIVSVIVGTLLTIIGIWVAIKYGKGTDKLWRDLRGLLGGQRRYV